MGAIVQFMGDGSVVLWEPNYDITILTAGQDGPPNTVPITLMYPDGGVNPFFGETTVYNVKTYDAAGDDETDDTDAFEAAIAAAISAGRGTIFVPDGIYKITRKLTIAVNAEQHISVVGSGRYQSVLRFADPADGGLDFVSTTMTANRTPVFAVKDLSLWTSNPNSGTAISATYAHSSNLTASVTITDVEISQDITRGADGGGGGFGYWTKGIYAYNARNTSISRMHMYGERHGGVQTTHGIHLDGETVAVDIYGCLVLEAEYGIKITGGCEGVYVYSTDLVAVDIGIDFDVLGEPQLTYWGGHISAMQTCIRLVNVLQSVVAGGVFYASSFESPDDHDPWMGVNISGAASRHISINNCVFGPEGGRGDVEETAIFIEDGHSYFVDNCHIFGFSGDELDYGVRAESGVGTLRIGQNMVYEDVLFPITGNDNTIYQFAAPSAWAVAGAGSMYSRFVGEDASTLWLQVYGAAANQKNAFLEMLNGSVTLKVLNDDLSLKADIFNTNATTGAMVIGQLAIPDGVTAPTAIAGKILIYGDVADGDLKAVFGDGTVKTIVTDT